MNPCPIIAAFLQMSSTGEQGKDFAIFQCQATATLLPVPAAASIIYDNTTTSLLMATKPICHHETLPWLLGHLPGNMDKTKLMVIINDFFDGGTAEVAIGPSKKSLGS